MRDVVAGQQAQEVRLAGAVGAEHRDALAEEDLGAERPHQPAELQLLAHHRADAGAPAAQAHRQALVARRLRRRPDLLELAQPGLHRLVAARHRRRDRRLHPQRAHELLEALVLLRPAAAQLLEPVDAVAARLGVRREAAAVDPRGARLDGHDAPRGLADQLAVVRDEEDRLRRLGELLLEPALARARRGSCRARRAAAPRRARAAAPPARAASARRRRGCARARSDGLLEGQAERLAAARLPQHLGLPAAGVAPVGERLRVGDLGAVLVARERVLGRGERLGAGAHGRRRDGGEQPAHGRLVAHAADELAHHAQAAGADDGALGRLVVARDQAQQRRLAGPVRAEQRGLRALADPERDVVQQRPAVGQRIAHACEVDMAHGRSFADPVSPRCAGPPIGVPRMPATSGQSPGRG